MHPITFINECITDDTFISNPRVPLRELYDKYSSWCITNDHHVHDVKDFMRLLRPKVLRLRVGNSYIFIIPTIPITKNPL